MVGLFSSTLLHSQILLGRQIESLLLELVKRSQVALLLELGGELGVHLESHLGSLFRLENQAVEALSDLAN